MRAAAFTIYSTFLLLDLGALIGSRIGRPAPVKRTSCVSTSQIGVPLTFCMW